MLGYHPGQEEADKSHAQGPISWLEADPSLPKKNSDSTLKFANLT